MCVCKTYSNIIMMHIFRWVLSFLILSLFTYLLTTKIMLTIFISAVKFFLLGCYYTGVKKIFERDLVQINVLK